MLREQRRGVFDEVWPAGAAVRLSASWLDVSTLLGLLAFFATGARFAREPAGSVGGAGGLSSLGVRDVALDAMLNFFSSAFSNSSSWPTYRWSSRSALCRWSGAWSIRMSMSRGRSGCSSVPVRRRARGEFDSRRVTLITTCDGTHGRRQGRGTGGEAEAAKARTVGQV